MMTYTLSTKLIKTEGDTIKGKVCINSMVETSENLDIAREVYKCMLKGLLGTLEQDRKEKKRMANAMNKNYMIHHNQNFYRIFHRSGCEVMQVMVPNDMDFGMDATLMSDLVKSYEKRLRRQY